MWNDSFVARFAGPYRAQTMQDDLDECRVGGASSRHCLDVGCHDRVDYARVLPEVDRLCRSTARYRDQSSGRSSGRSSDPSNGDWQRQWNQCAFVWDQWATLIRSDLEAFQRNMGGATSATGITASNLGHDYRAFLALESRWLRSSRRPPLPESWLVEAERPSTPRPPMSLTGSPLPSRLVPSAPPLSMPWMDDLGVAWPPSSVSGQDPSPAPSSWRR